MPEKKSGLLIVAMKPVKAGASAIKCCYAVFEC